LGPLRFPLPQTPTSTWTLPACDLRGLISLLG
jgi:hypothetical protein